LVMAIRELVCRASMRELKSGPSLGLVPSDGDTFEEDMKADTRPSTMPLRGSLLGHGMALVEMYFPWGWPVMEWLCTLRCNTRPRGGGGARKKSSKLQVQVEVQVVLHWQPVVPSYFTAMLLALLPPGPKTSLYDYAPCARAAEEAAFRRESAAGLRAQLLADAVVVSDEECCSRPMEVFELMSSGPRVSLSIPCYSELPYLVLHVKDVGRFCSFELDLEDSEGKPRKVHAGNKQASVRLSGENDSLSVPLELVPGWNHVRLDLVSLLQIGFGCKYACTRGVTVVASCRVARIWLESRVLEDKELPPWLATLS
jgi:hypothetical protein